MKYFSIFKKIDAREIESFKQDVLKDKHLLAEVNTDGVSYLQIAVMNGNCELAQFVINNNINLDHQDNSGSTALHYCPDYKQYDIAKYILEKKGRLDISDKYGNEPLWTAIQNYKGHIERLEIIKLFLMHGANKTHRNNVNKTPFDIALKYKELEEYLNQSHNENH